MREREHTNNTMCKCMEGTLFCKYFNYPGLAHQWVFGKTSRLFMLIYTRQPLISPSRPRIIAIINTQITFITR
jgi:hypothetical protein